MDRGLEGAESWLQTLSEQWESFPQDEREERELYDDTDRSSDEELSPSCSVMAFILSMETIRLVVGSASTSGTEVLPFAPCELEGKFMLEDFSTVENSNPIVLLLVVKKMNNNNAGHFKGGHKSGGRKQLRSLCPRQQEVRCGGNKRQANATVALHGKEHERAFHRRVLSFLLSCSKDNFYLFEESIFFM